MTFDATFWVAVSFIIFFGALIYLKVPRKIDELLGNMISDIKKEIDESEKLRAETKSMLDEAKQKLDTADKEVNKIIKNFKINFGTPVRAEYSSSLPEPYNERRRPAAPDTIF